MKENRQSCLCLRCGKEFRAKKNHGKLRKFCSIECRKLNWPQPDWKECPSCGGKFLAKRSFKSEDLLRKYCSTKCLHKDKMSGEIRKCVCCGMDFYSSLSEIVRANGGGTCCSIECNRQYYQEERSSNWKGGKYYDAYSATTMVTFNVDGRSHKYIGEHRIISIRAIGRLLDKSEPVIHINGLKTDNRPENLFICKSMSECAKIREGSLPWPKRGNLDTYK